MLFGAARLFAAVLTALRAFPWEGWEGWAGFMAPNVGELEDLIANGFRGSMRSDATVLKTAAARAVRRERQRAPEDEQEMLAVEPIRVRRKRCIEWRRATLEQARTGHGAKTKAKQD